MERRLVALLAMDVAGYSRLMRTDEAGTVARLAQARERIDQAIATHQGRIFNTAGDSVLAEFSRPVQALRCALQIQTREDALNTAAPKPEPMHWRIGVHVGDVIVQDGDLLGDGVNIAARLESLAQPGGICISRVTHDQVSDRLDAVFHDLGAQSVKNIDRPVHVFGWTPSGSAPTSAPLPQQPDPTIAVLAFENLSGDPAQDYLADGISEEIITTLSKVPGFQVVARHSSFVYKGQPVDVRTVGREQKATHVLEGSLRTAGNRVRIATQFVDTASGHHIWAERYDRELDDIFELQDEIALRIATALQGEMIGGEMDRLRGAGTRDLRAWELHVRANFTMRGVSKEANHAARALVLKALSRDPSYAAALSTLALSHAIDARHGFTDDRDQAIELARTHAQKALQIDPDNTEAHGVLGFVHLLERQIDAAIDKYRAALATNPNHAEVMMRLGLSLIFAGRAEESVRVAEKGLKLCPKYPPWYAGLYGFSLRAAGRLADSIPYFVEYGQKMPGFGHVDLVIVHEMLGDHQAARTEAAKLLQHRPDFTISAWSKSQLYSDPDGVRPDAEALRQAGLPD